MNKHLFHLAFLGACLPASAGTIYVDSGAAAGGDGTGWADARTSLSTAAEKAVSGDEIWVKAGSYGPIALKDGVRIYGGFAGTETAASASDPRSHVTIITGGGVGRAVVSIRNDSSAVLRGFTITGGFVDFPDTGGGLYLEYSDATIVACVFTGNRSTTLGGALANWGGSPMFVNCRFHDNDGGGAGGAVFNRKSGSPHFVNCLFHDNRAGEAGAVSVLTGTPTFTNCTFTRNIATRSKGGALYDALSGTILRNCVLWGNLAAVAGTDEIYDYPLPNRATTVRFSDVAGGWPGQGNMDVDPLFVDPAASDFRLQGASPAVEVGDASALPQDRGDVNWDGVTTAPVSADLDLRPRVWGESVDMGAFEYVPPGSSP